MIKSLALVAAVAAAFFASAFLLPETLNATSTDGVVMGAPLQGVSAAPEAVDPFRAAKEAAKFTELPAQF